MPRRPSILVLPDKGTPPRLCSINKIGIGMDDMSDVHARSEQQEQQQRQPSRLQPSTTGRSCRSRRSRSSKGHKYITWIRQTHRKSFACWDLCRNKTTAIYDIKCALCFCEWLLLLYVDQVFHRGLVVHKIRVYPRGGRIFGSTKSKKTNKIYYYYY